jgi:hypothetical protein
LNNHRRSSLFPLFRVMTSQDFMAEYEHGANV